MAAENNARNRLKIFIVSLDEPLYVPVFFSEIFKVFHENICAVTLLSPVHNKKVSEGISDSFWRLLKTRLRYYGLRDFLKYAGLHFLYRVKGLFPNNRPRFYSLKTLARAYGRKIVPCPSNNINDKAYIKLIGKYNPDVIICLVPQIAKEGFLKTAKIGCLNTHCSLLPKNRGREPLFWAMLNQDKYAGVSVHLMDKDIDTGAILKQGKIAVDQNETLHSLYIKSSQLGARLMVETINDIKNNSLKPIKIDEKDSTYNPWPSEKDVALFRRLGKRFI